MSNRIQKVEPTSVSKPCSNAMLAAGGSDPALLQRFMKEFFPYGEFRKAGIFTKEMRGDYYWQAYKICHYLGLKTVYEYGKDEIRCHVSYVEGKRPPGTPFVEVYPSIYD